MIPRRSLKFDLVPEWVQVRKPENLQRYSLWHQGEAWGMIPRWSLKLDLVPEWVQVRKTEHLQRHPLWHYDDPFSASAVMLNMNLLFITMNWIRRVGGYKVQALGPRETSTLISRYLHVVAERRRLVFSKAGDMYHTEGRSPNHTW